MGESGMADGGANGWKRAVGINDCWKRAVRLDGGGAAGWERAGWLDGGAAGWKRAVGPMPVGRELDG